MNKVIKSAVWLVIKIPRIILQFIVKATITMVHVYIPFHNRVQITFQQAYSCRHHCGHNVGNKGPTSLNYYNDNVGFYNSI